MVEANSRAAAEIPRVEELPMQAAAAPAETPAPTPEPPKPKPIPFAAYKVQQGDTLSSIAAKFGITAKSIAWNNGEIRNPDMLNIGQELLIPSQDGIVHSIRQGETLSEIASRYDVDLQAILDANGIEDPDMLPQGLMVLVPGAVPPPPPPAPAPAAVPPAPAATSAPAAVSQPSRPETVAAAQSSTSGFIWPFRGPITTYFGEPGASGSYHKGIDIDGYGRAGAPVVAAASGKVVFVARVNYDYGWRVIIDHGDGWETLYAHLSRIDVSVGQSVQQGETIGGVGSTGYSTGTHLHFEIHRYGRALNPLDYLP